MMNVFSLKAMCSKCGYDGYNILYDMDKEEYTLICASCGRIIGRFSSYSFHAVTEEENKATADTNSTEDNNEPFVSAD